MLGHLWDLLALNTPDGEDPQRAARTLRVVLAALTAASAIPLVFEWLLLDRPLLRITLVAALLLFALAYWLTSRGRLPLARFTVMFAVLGVLTLVLYTGRSGIHAVTTMMYPAALVVGAMILGRRGFLVITALSVISATGLVVADIRGLIHTPYHDVAAYRDMIAPACFLLFTAFCVRLLAADLIRSLQRARRHEQDLAAANARLEQQASALEESEARWRTYIERATDLVFSLDEGGRLASVNEAACRTFGYEAQELLGRNPLDFVAGDARGDVTQMLERVRAGEVLPAVEVRARTRDGRPIVVEVRGRSVAGRGRAVGLFFIGRDVTERKKLEEERRLLDLRVQAAQKVEGLGALAGGIAHDFNNLLMAILGNLDIAKEEVSPASGAWKPLCEAEAAARRAAELTRQMLAYSGKATVLVQEVNLSDAVQEMGEVLRVSATRRVTLSLELQPGLPKVRADVARIRQALVSLVMNAAEATGESGGQVTVSTAVVHRTREQLASTWLQDDLRPGEYVELAVTDDGSGMEQETLARMFDPFFTTKFAGRGLGLAAVLGIVRAHKGAISVESVPGRGTCVRVYLPALPVGSAAA